MDKKSVGDQDLLDWPIFREVVAVMLRRSIKKRGKANLFQALAHSERLGLPMADVLRVIEQECLGSRSRKSALYAGGEGYLARYLLDDISKGKLLSEAMAGRPLFFETHEVALVQVGEQSENLGSVFENLARFDKMDRQYGDFQYRMKYALALMAGGGFFIYLIMILIMPKFVAIFNDLGVSLPPITERLMVVVGCIEYFVGFVGLVTDAFYNYFVIGLPASPFLLLIVLMALYYHLFYRRGIERFLKFIPSWNMLNLIPFLERMTRKLALSHFLFSLGAMLEARLPAADALRQSGNVTRHPGIQKAALSAANSVEKGLPISQALAEQSVFPMRVHRMVFLGECNEDLPQLCLDTALWIGEDWKVAMLQLGRLAEPAIIIALGVIAGLVIIAVYSPIFALSRCVSAQWL